MLYGVVYNVLLVKAATLLTIHRMIVKYLIVGGGVVYCEVTALPVLRLKVLKMAVKLMHYFESPPQENLH